MDFAPDTVMNKSAKRSEGTDVDDGDIGVATLALKHRQRWWKGETWPSVVTAQNQVFALMGVRRDSVTVRLEHDVLFICLHHFEKIYMYRDYVASTSPWLVRSLCWCCGKQRKNGVLVTRKSSFKTFVSLKCYRVMSLAAVWKENFLTFRGFNRHWQY